MEGDRPQRLLTPLPEGLVLLAGDAQGVEGALPLPPERGQAEGGPSIARLPRGLEGPRPAEGEADLHHAPERVGRHLEEAPRLVEPGAGAADLLLEGREVPALVLELGAHRVGAGALAEALDPGLDLGAEPALEQALDLLEQHRAERTELALYGGDLAHHRAQDPILGPVRVDEVVAADLARGLPRAVDAPVALLHARRVPRDVEVEEIRAVGLEVQPLASGVGGDQDPEGVLGRGGVERPLDGGAGVVAHAAVEHTDPVLAVVGGVDGSVQDLHHVAERVRVLGEEDHAAVRPGAALLRLRAEAGSGALLPADPVEQGEELGVRAPAGLLGEGAELPEQHAGLLGGGRQGARLGRQGRVLFGREGLVVEAVAVRILAEGEAALLGRRAGPALLLEAAGVGVDGPREGLGAREQALLQVHEHQPPAAARRGAELRVAQQLLRQLELERGRRAELAVLGRRVPAGVRVVRGRLDPPAAVPVPERELHEQAVGEAALVDDLTQVPLEPADHHRVEILPALDRGAAGEAGGIEDLEQGAEAVRVAVVRGGAQKEPVIEARGQVPDGPGGVRVGGILARRSGGRDVGLVEDEQALAGAVAEAVDQGVAVFGAAQERVRDDEAVVRRPGVGPEAALLPAPGDELPRHHLEPQAEAPQHLVPPLQAHARRADHEDEVRLLAEQELLEHQARLDGLAEADVVGDEQVGPRQLERLHQRRELVVLEHDPGAERRLKAGRVGGADGVPLEGVQVRPEVLGRIEPGDGAEPLELGGDHPGAELQVPEHVEAAAGVVVVQAHEPEERRLARAAGERRLDQPLPVAGLHHLALVRQVPWRGRSGAFGGRPRVEPCRHQDARLQVAAGPRGLVEPVPAAHRPELVTAELAQHGRQPALELVRQVPDEVGLGDPVRLRGDPERAEQVEQPRLAEGGEGGGDGGDRGPGQCTRAPPSSCIGSRQLARGAHRRSARTVAPSVRSSEGAQSGWWDLNPQQPAPKAGPLPD